MFYQLLYHKFNFYKLIISEKYFVSQIIIQIERVSLIKQSQKLTLFLSEKL